MKHVMKANICGRKAPHLLKFIPFVSCKKENPDLQATTMHPKKCPLSNLPGSIANKLYPKNGSLACASLRRLVASHAHMRWSEQL